jgi:hypothetical protein
LHKECEDLSETIPAFLVAGGMRCATGWIRQCLREHPDIYMPQKEPHFYDRNFEKGLGWYQNFFDDYLGEQVIGEKTASYFHNSNVPENILKINPEMKVIVCLRDPIERMFSQYSMFAESDTKLKELGFVSSAKPGTSLVNRSRYAEQVKLFQENIPSENLEFIIYEEKDYDPIGYIQKLYQFLGVNPNFQPISAELRTKQGQFEYNHWFWRPISKYMLHPRAPISFRKIYSRFRPDIHAPRLEDSIYETLSTHFDDIYTLEELLGRRLDCWRTKQYVTA